MNFLYYIAQTVAISAATPLLKETAKQTGLYITNAYLPSLMSNIFKSEKDSEHAGDNEIESDLSKVVSSLTSQFVGSLTENKQQMGGNAQVEPSNTLKLLGKEFLSNGLSSGLLMVASLEIGKSIFEKYYNTHSDLQEKPEVNTTTSDKKITHHHTFSIQEFSEFVGKGPDKRTVMYILTGLLTYLLYKTGETDIRKFIENEKLNEKKVKNTLDDKTIDIALGLLDNIELHRSQYSETWSLYHFIVDKLYKGHEHYDSHERQPPFLSRILNVNPLRVFFNIIVGLSIQFNSMVTFDTSSGLHSLKWLNTLLYIEMLAHVLRIHQRAPISFLVQSLIKFLFPEYYSSQVYITKEKNGYISPDNPWKRKK